MKCKGCGKEVPSVEWITDLCPDCLPKCFGEMLSAGFNKDCDRCAEKLPCLKETNRRLKKRENITEQEKAAWLKYRFSGVLGAKCSMGVCE